MKRVCLAVAIAATSFIVSSTPAAARPPLVFQPMQRAYPLAPVIEAAEPTLTPPTPPTTVPAAVIHSETAGQAKTGLDGPRVPLAPVALPTTTTVAPAAVFGFASLPEPWRCIAWHESTDQAAISTGNGYYGAFQFSPTTWNVSAAEAGHPEWENGDAAAWPLYDQFVAGEARAATRGNYGDWYGDGCISYAGFYTGQLP